MVCVRGPLGAITVNRLAPGGSRTRFTNRGRAQSRRLGFYDLPFHHVLLPLQVGRGAPGWKIPLGPRERAEPRLGRIGVQEALGRGLDVRQVPVEQGQIQQAIGDAEILVHGQALA